MARSDDAATTSSSGGSGSGSGSGSSGSATSGTAGTSTPQSASSTASVASRSLLSVRRSSFFNNNLNSSSKAAKLPFTAAPSDLIRAAAAGSPVSPAESGSEAASGTLTTSTSTSGAGFAFGRSSRRRSSTASSPIDAPNKIELSHRPKTSSPNPVATLNCWNTILAEGPLPTGATSANASTRHSSSNARTKSMSPNEPTPTGPAMTNHRMQQDLTTTFAPSFSTSSSSSSSNAHAHALVNQPSFIRPHTASALVLDAHSSTATLPKAASKQHAPSSTSATSATAPASATPEPSTPTGAFSSSSSNAMSTSAMYNNTSNKLLIAQINTASRSSLPSASGPSPLSATRSSALASTTTATSSVPNPNSSSRRGEAILPHDKVARAPATSMYWSRTPVSGRLPRPMRAHTAVVVDISIYCFGGCDLKGVCFRDVWKLDGDSFLWSKVKVLGDIPPVTRAHTSTVVGSRIWVIAGGDGPNYSSSVYYFETSSHEWVKPKVYGPTPSKRRAHAAVLYGSRIIIFGGGNGSNALQDVHSLDVSNHYRPTWSELQVRGPKPVRRGYHSMTLVGAKAIVFGGSDGTECFSDMFVLDLEALTWTEVIPEPPAPVSSTNATSNVGPPIRAEAFPRLSHSATLLGSYLVIFGGHDGIDFSNELLFFNLVSLQWEPRSAHGHAPSPRGYHTCVLHDSRLLCIGGFDGKQVFDECFSLDLGALAFLPQVTQFKLDVYSDQEEDEGERREERG